MFGFIFIIIFSYVCSAYYFFLAPIDIVVKVNKMVVSSLNHILHVANFLTVITKTSHPISSLAVMALKLLMSLVFSSQASTIFMLELKHIFGGGKMLKYQGHTQASLSVEKG